MKSTIIKVTLLLSLLLLFVSWHIKIVFLYFIFRVLRKYIPNYITNKKLINRTSFVVLIVSFWFLFPNRTSNKSNYIQSVYFDTKTNEKVGVPLIPYITNLISEGDIMTAVSLGFKILPDKIQFGGAIGNIKNYSNKSSFFKNNFHVPYRQLEWYGSPPHNVPFQMMQDLGFYKNLNHYFLHIPEVNDLDELKEREVIVFCHGYAGNWVLYTALLAQYTEAIIISVETPSFNGYFSSNTMHNILNKSLPHAFKQIGIPYKKPHLIGLSNGGSAVNTAIVSYPKTFKSYTILSAGLSNFPKTKSKVNIIYGSNDRSGWISKNIPKSKYNLYRIKGEDHSLLVANPEVTFKIINKIVEK